MEDHHAQIDLLDSPLFIVKETPTSGRGVFATEDIPKGTPLLLSDFLTVTLLLRAYRREVCGRCFAYERGRHLKFWDVDTNHAFCSDDCSQVWSDDVGELGRAAWSSIETFVRTKMGKATQRQQQQQQQQQLISINGTTPGDEDTVLPDAQRPSEKEIDEAWKAVSSTAWFVREARSGSSARIHRRAVDAALQASLSTDILYLLVSGVLARASTSTSKSWEAVLALVPEPTPYATAVQLQEHTYAYLQLLALLPPELLPFVTPLTCRETVGRDTRNSFGIRSLDDGGDEFFGWGIWPAASYFNHGCAPNVAKMRHGRQWRFSASRHVRLGEELLISYLGGEEAVASVEERREKLEPVWGFRCGCLKCMEEEKDGLMEVDVWKAE